MKYSWFTLLLLLMATETAPAQRPVITPETPVNANLLQQWFRSGDPRLIAWAADFARRTHDTKIIAEMPAWLESSPIPPPTYKLDEPQPAQRQAVIAVLDTLIQENVQVPIPAIEAVAPYFPDQATILIGRLPLEESRATLNDWIYGQEGNWSGRTLARVAAMMLAQDPVSMKPEESSFASRIVAASEEDLQVSVVSRGSGQNGSWAGGACGDSLPRKIPPGWPQIYSYELTENDPQAMNAPVVVDLYGDRIVYWRVDKNAGWGTCNAVQWLNPVTRHRLIAYWLGVREQDMQWQPVKQVSIRWKCKAVYEQLLGILVEAEREKLQATVQSLYRRGVLTKNQTVTTAPRLVVTIKCDMEPCPLK
ncbi:MAG: hypothetical protein ACYCO5_02165 [Acidobacteriaceae bacterium]